jgi:uncharacterized protein (UPF0276 family)
VAVALGCSWFEQLAEHPDIVDSLDFIQVPGWLLSDDFERPHARLILHNLDQDWSMAAIDAIYPDWPERLRWAIQLTRTPWFSMHLGFASEQVRFDGHMHPASEPLDRQELLARVVEVTNEARLHCPLQVLLENLDYCPEGAYEHVCEPAFIAEAVEMTGAGLLFDIAHWRVSGSWLGFDPLAALDELPLERIVEIHVSSPRPLNDGSGRLDDSHEMLAAADYQLLAAVLEHSIPRAVTIEYSRDLERLHSQLADLRAVLAYSDPCDQRQIPRHDLWTYSASAQMRYHCPSEELGIANVLRSGH